MPTYDYRCEACGHRLELYQGIAEAPKRRCPACGKQRLKRVIGAGAGIIFKGSGFYQTDYRSESYKQGQEAEKKPDGGAADKQPAGEASAAKAPEPTKKKKKKPDAEG